MLLYCRDGVVIATHSDDQIIEPSRYGDGVFVVPVDDGAALTRAGELPAGWPEGEIDPRPFATPAASPDLLARCAAIMRFLKEMGGISVGGVSVATDRQSQALITGAALNARIDEEFTTQWKGPGGTFTELTAAQIIDVGKAVSAHVAACFAREAMVVADITGNSPSITTFDGVAAAFEGL